VSIEYLLPRTGTSRLVVYPSFAQHPFAYVRSDVRDAHPLALAGIQEANHLDSHELHVREVQDDLRSAGPDLLLQLLEALGLEPPDEAHPRDFAALDPFDLERHLESSGRARRLLQGRGRAEPR